VGGLGRNSAWNTLVELSFEQGFSALVVRGREAGRRKDVGTDPEGESGVAGLLEQPFQRVSLAANHPQSIHTSPAISLLKSARVSLDLGALCPNRPTPFRLAVIPKGGFESA